jgi:hypothetical protein
MQLIALLASPDWVELPADLLGSCYCFPKVLQEVLRTQRFCLCEGLPAHKDWVLTFYFGIK